MIYLTNYNLHRNQPDRPVPAGPKRAAQVSGIHGAYQSGVYIRDEICGQGKAGLGG